MTEPLTTANPGRTVLDTTVQPLSTSVVIYSVRNDPEEVKARVANGTLHPTMEEQFLDPLFESEMDGAAKRFLLWTNEHNPTRDLGPVRMYEQVITRSRLREISGNELADIDEGRRPNG